MSQTGSSNNEKGRAEEKASSTSESETKTGKVETSLIETILDEMKNEFNRSVKIEKKENLKKEKNTEENSKREKGTEENSKKEKGTEENSKKEKGTEENSKKEKGTEENSKKEKASEDNPKKEKASEDNPKKEKSSVENSKKEIATEENSKKEEVPEETPKIEKECEEDSKKDETSEEILNEENPNEEDGNPVPKEESNVVKRESLKMEKDENEQHNVGVSDENSELVANNESTEEKQKEDQECAEIPTEPNKVEAPVNEEGEGAKSEILIPLKKEDDAVDANKKTKSRITQNSEARSDDTGLLAKAELEVESVAVPTLSTSIITPSTTPKKRSLRSATVKTPVEEPAGVKRSARRRSKDSPRESVLQSAIARKEKSFSSLNQSEDKSSSGRNVKSHSRPSPTERNKSKSPARAPPPPPRSPRLAQQIAEQANARTLKAEENCAGNTDVETTTAAAATTTTSTLLEKQSDPSSALKTNVRRLLKSAVPSASSQAYTKTGKRRYRPYKGLRYSFTGNNVRRTRPPRRHLKTAESSSTGSATEDKKSPDLDAEESNETVELPQEDTSAVATIQPESLECPDPIAKSHAAEFPNIDMSGSRRASPVMAEACQTTSQKRKHQPDEEEDDVKECGNKRNRHSNVPSPSPADSTQGPAKPESTAISTGAGTAGLCCCQIKSLLFVSSRGQNGVNIELYCQAMDTLDDRLVGCCNAVTSQDTRLLRASQRVPYLILCDIHTERLLRHNCCPGCGIFCTQGRFVQCASNHWYHRDCQLTADSALVCPHCGLDSPSSDVLLSMRCAKNPVFLPQQKPPKKVPSAKMTFTTSRSPDNKKEEVILREPSPPLVPPALLTSSQISSASLDKDKLAELLSVACSMRKRSSLPLPRYSLKSLYQAAKTGNAEKLVHVLATGFNPNHLFRDCSMGTALHAASAGGHLSVVHILVQAGANKDVLDRDQNTPLMLAALANHSAVVKYLVKAGANVMLKGCDGMTALHLAAKAGNLESCHYLLAVPNIGRAYIDNLDDGGWTPLVWAAEHCHVEVARYLLKNRADPLIRDAEQNIALHWSAFSGSVDISEMLLNYGCGVNSTNVHGDTPLHIGARQNMYNCVLLLLARGARVDIANKAGDQPLDCCIALNSDCYVAINLNIQLKSIVANPREKTQRILTNDISRGQEQNPIQCVNVEDDEDEPTDFVYISENCFTSNINVERTITSLQSCRCTDTCTTVSCHCGNISLRCWYDEQGRLLPEFNYADPPMLFECNQACTCNRVTCHNRVVQHGLTSRFQLFRTKDKGWGVRTLRPISKGTYVCEYIGEIISDCEADHREDDSYLFDLDNRDGETYCIDARHYGNVARFINHMCVPNLLPVRVFIEHQDLHFPRIAFFANRDIEAEEELGFDYGEKFWIIKCKSFTCTCGAESCRYSETTIQQTLDNYNKRLLQDELLMQQTELQLLQ